MGWSVPKVPARAPATACSPWVCLFIILLGVFIGLTWVLLSAPAGGLASLSSGAWLPLTGSVLIGIMAAITLYLLWWEIQALCSWFWNSWRLNMHNAWRRQAHQHLCVVSQVMLTPDAHYLPRLIGLARDEESENTPSTLLPGEPLVPGIFRFEQLCRALIAQATSSLSRWYPSGEISLVIQTASEDEASANEQQQSITALWQQQALPWPVTVQILPPTFPFGYWNEHLAEINHPVLVLALNYRQAGESQAEIACALLLAPSSLTPPAVRKDAIKLFRAMPLKIASLTAELNALRDMDQQPSGAIRLVWLSGLTAPQRQRLTTAVNELPLSLTPSAPGAGVIDFDQSREGYGHLASWLMIAAAVETANYDMGSHWLIQTDEKEAWAMVAGNESVVPHHQAQQLPTAPYPAGGVMLATVLNSLLLWILASAYPTWLFSWWGMACILPVLGITLPGIALVLRKIVARLLLPGFIRAAREFDRDSKS